MRFLLKGQPYEKPIISGKLTYQSGRVESWRLSNALEGFKFLRSDVDERETTGRSILYHAVIRPDGLVENLKYRAFGTGFRVRGQILRDEKVLTNTREVDGQRYEEELVLDDDPAIWYPTVAGLIAAAPLLESSVGITVDPAAVEDHQPENWFKVRPFMLEMSHADGTWTFTDRDQSDFTIGWLNWESDSAEIHGGAYGEDAAKVTRSFRY